MHQDKPDFSVRPRHEAVPPLEALRAARRRLLAEHGVCAANSPDLVIEMALRAVEASQGPDNSESG